MRLPDQVRWFDPLGRCSGLTCAKEATGILRGPRNESYGNYCGRCADKRLRRAEKERQQFADASAKMATEP
jgi:hypothetical protein